MGIYDRDYYREPAGGGMGGFRIQSITVWLIVINVAVFLMDGMSDGLLRMWGYFSMDTAIYQYQVWRFITFQFLHAGTQHIFFNMLSLYFFGPFVESWLGQRRFLAFYLLSGIGGAVAYMILAAAHVIGDSAAGALVGASAGIFGVLIGAAKIAPNAQVILFIFPMQMKTMVWVFIAMAVYAVVFSGVNGGGQAAHLGGALVGWILMNHENWLNFALRSHPRMRIGGTKVKYKDWSKDLNR